MARAGRKRKEGPREPNGQLSRNPKAWTGETERAARAVATNARVRLWGVPAELAGQPEAGTVVGRMFLAGTLSREEYEAAVAWQLIRNAYQRAIGAPPAYEEHRPEVAPTSTFEEFCRSARSRYDAIQSEFASQANGALLLQALDLIVIRDVDAPYLIRFLRKALQIVQDAA